MMKFVQQSVQLCTYKVTPCISHWCCYTQTIVILLCFVCHVSSMICFGEISLPNGRISVNENFPSGMDSYQSLITHESRCMRVFLCFRDNLSCKYDVPFTIENKSEVVYLAQALGQLELGSHDCKRLGVVTHTE